MKDIARLAGVSTSTVSHVINNSRFVSDEIKQRVNKIVVDLNYTPSFLARSLKIKETSTIGMLVTTTTNPFFSEVIHYVERYCEAHHYHLLLVNTDADNLNLSQHLDRFSRKQVDGLLLMCTEPHTFNARLIEKMSMPTVIMDWWPMLIHSDKIYENAELGGYLATKALIESGYQRIAIITGELTKPLASSRLKGYKQALLEYGLKVCSHWIIESAFNFESGFESTRQLLTQADKPDAIFATSDSIAVGVYQAIWREGLHIPQDIAVIGYDNIVLSQYLTPPLSTIHQPKERLAKKAVEQLISRIHNPDQPFKTIILDPKLIKRESF